MLRLRTGPGKSGRPGLSGGLGKRGYGGNVNPPCNRKGRNGNPPPTTGAPELYPDQQEAIEVPQIIIHKTDQPDVVLHFLDADPWPAKTVLKLIFFVPRRILPQRV